MSQNNNLKALSNLLWRFFERIGVQGVNFIVSIILARLLEPSAYGTIALVNVFTSILGVFAISGFGTALVQKKDADDLDFSSVFYFNLFMSIGLYVLLFFSAPLISSFYRDMQLIPVIRIMGLTLIINGINNVQNAYISRNLLFRKTFFSTLTATFTSAIIGIVMAYTNFGIWALVFQGLSSSFFSTLIIWLTIPWKPKWIFSSERLKGLFSFGWKLLTSSLLDTVYNNIRSLIIGKMYSSADLAFYNKGRIFPYFIIDNINTSIGSVLLPTMSQEQDNKTRIKSMTRRAIRTSTYIMAPMMIGLAVCAKPFIHLILTDKWLNCVFFLRIFCITFMFYPIHTANLNAINAMGRSDWFLKLEIVKKIVGVTLVLATMFISVEAMAYSLLLNTLLATMINAYPNKKLLNYSWTEQMKDILPHITLSVLMGIPVLMLQFLPLSQIAILIIQILTGAVIYISASALLKLEIFNYLLGVAKDFLKNGKK